MIKLTVNYVYRQMSFASVFESKAEKNTQNADVETLLATSQVASNDPTMEKEGFDIVVRALESKMNKQPFEKWLYS